MAISDGLWRQAASYVDTFMGVVSWEDIPPAIRLGAVKILLSDHHFWGGLRLCQSLSTLCQTFGLGLSMHSNTHLGISLAAMVHLGASTPYMTYALDTHYPWLEEDVVTGGSCASTVAPCPSRTARDSASSSIGSSPRTKSRSRALR